MFPSYSINRILVDFLPQTKDCYTLLLRLNLSSPCYVREKKDKYPPCNFSPTNLQHESSPFFSKHKLNSVILQTHLNTTTPGSHSEGGINLISVVAFLHLIRVGVRFGKTQLNCIEHSNCPVFLLSKENGRHNAPQTKLVELLVFIVVFPYSIQVGAQSGETNLNCIGQCNGPVYLYNLYLPSFLFYFLSFFHVKNN